MEEEVVEEEEDEEAEDISFSYYTYYTMQPDVHIQVTGKTLPFQLVPSHRVRQ